MRKLTAGVGVLLSSLVVGSGIYFDWFNIGDKKEPVTEVDTIGEAITLIEEKSVYNTKKDALVEGALRGMADAIKDPYSTYYSKEEAEQHRQMLAEERVGIGIELSENKGKFIVVSPVRSSPAEKAGMRSLDEIVQVDGVRVDGKTMSELMHLIQGEKGTKVTIVVYRPSEDKHIKMTMERAAISNKTVSSEVVKVEDTAIGYVSISLFGEKTANEWVAETSKLLRKDVEGIVIDVRDNPGGYLHSVAALLSTVLDSGKVFAYMQNAEGAMEPLKTQTKGIDEKYLEKMNKIPIVVLQNQGSASASEVLSGALKSWGRASLVGVKSFGKGTVQESWELSNGGELKLSTNKWLTPKREWIHGQGIEASLVIEQNELFAFQLHPLTGKFKVGDMSEEISYSQNALQKLGYQIDRLDGYMDDTTAEAVNLYRKQKKLKLAEDEFYMDTTFFNSLNETLKNYKVDRQNDQQFQMATSFLLHAIEQ
ncbi:MULTISPECIES: S41 family peptidase [Lysinibacillus]|uniref:Peptidase S41 n=1 Tax=Lysinibacillus fusiformis TaxID=28031 RepID=A0A1E4R354_9BACI|nr:MULTISPECIES: S41 family peptidase [Lysinibacillus]MCR8851238.1 S41 family peptidase [Lysinibacillus fusiformis]ODV54893.1 peptidase S41 [Lysinibacillus fusiformis]WKT77768.1 S41 family peptidase [Lysinibacillus fusiformis]HBJ01393.1 PDZ domain-containing protein [Lysinibacillus sp.]